VLAQPSHGLLRRPTVWRGPSPISRCLRVLGDLKISNQLLLRCWPSLLWVTWSHKLPPSGCIPGLACFTFAEDKRSTCRAIPPLCTQVRHRYIGGQVEDKRRTVGVSYADEIWTLRTSADNQRHNEFGSVVRHGFSAQQAAPTLPLPPPLPPLLAGGGLGGAVGRGVPGEAVPAAAASANTSSPYCRCASV
jgi:hypothetical protein